LHQTEGYEKLHDGPNLAAILGAGIADKSDTVVLGVISGQITEAL
jgi:hypothetical protein